MIEALVRSDFEAQPEAVEIKTSIIAPIRRVSAARPIGKSAPLHVNRCLAQPGFVLHSYPYKETSLILDVFSRDYGRVSLVAKGAKRPHSQLRNVLQSFQPLILGWSGKSEVRTLISAEWVGGMLPLEKVWALMRILPQ